LVYKQGYFIMDTFFVEEIKGKKYKIAVIDKHRIFGAVDPGILATVFECSATNPTRKDDAEIFYALAPLIGADDLLADLTQQHRSQKLNSWSIATKNQEMDNLFLAVEPLTRNHRLELYSFRHSITPEHSITSCSNSLFSLVSFADQQKWKNGVLQECIDRLAKLEYRHNPQVYSVIDEQYRRIMRFKLETENVTLENNYLQVLILFIRRLVSLLGLKNSHDPTIFTINPTSIDHLIKDLINMIPVYTPRGSLKDQLSDILTMWSGSSIRESKEGFRLHVDETVIEGLTYLQTFLPKPQNLVILNAPM